MSLLDLAMRIVGSMRMLHWTFCVCLASTPRFATVIWSRQRRVSDLALNSN
jgi:hypothetical protein